MTTEQALRSQLVEARDIITRLLDAANQGSENLHELVECAEYDGDNDEAITEYREREEAADKAIEEARALLELPIPA